MKFASNENLNKFWCLCNFLWFELTFYGSLLKSLLLIASQNVPFIRRQAAFKQYGVVEILISSISSSLGDENFWSESGCVTVIEIET